MIGNYLRKPDGFSARMASGLNTADFVHALQAAGAIRRDIDAAVVAHILESLSYGQLTIGDFRPPDQFPPYEAVMEALAYMLDRALLPEDGGHSEAGKAVFRQMTAAARAQMEQIKQVKQKNAASESRS